jgi:hypothetical protein
MTERELVGQGIDSPEWFGKMEIRYSRVDDPRVIYSLKPISGISLSTAVIVEDLIPYTKCLWVEYKSYGWSDPHCAARNGILLMNEGASLKPIWTQTLEERCGGGGTGERSTFEFKFPKLIHPIGLGHDVEIAGDELIWAETQAELEHPLKTPKRVIHQRFLFDGIKFVPVKDDAETK